MIAKTDEWTVEEVHGIWWAYKGPRPSDEAFHSHGRSARPLILGPFVWKDYAEAAIEKAKKEGR